MQNNEINISAGDESAKAAIPGVLEAFLDAESVEEKHRILEERADEVDGHIILNMEISLDIVADQKATLDDRIGYVLYYLRTRGRFEGTRLRS